MVLWEIAYSLSVSQYSWFSVFILCPFLISSSVPFASPSVLRLYRIEAAAVGVERCRKKLSGELHPGPSVL